MYRNSARRTLLQLHLAVVVSTVVLASCRTSRAAVDQQAVDASAAVEELLAVDREFSAKGKAGTVLSVLPQMFDAHVVMLSPGGFTRSNEEATALLRTNPLNATSSIEWSPIRGGVSSDGQHGYTQGYMEMGRPDGTKALAKYLAYWIRRPVGWRVLVYKRVPRPAGDVSLAMLAPALPERGLAAGSSSDLGKFDAELRRAESAFSDDAAKMGIGNAFRKWGAPDAVNLGAGASWVQGPENIAAGQDNPSGPSIVWSSDTVIVAATGDLGVSIGRLRITPKATGDSASATRIQQFFTIWKRRTPADAWRYIAE